MQKVVESVPKLRSIPVREIRFMANGTVRAYTNDGNQVAEFNGNWVETYFKHLREQGIQPQDVQLSLPNGRVAKYNPVQDNYRLE